MQHLDPLQLKRAALRESGATPASNGSDAPVEAHLAVNQATFVTEGSTPSRPTSCRRTDEAKAREATTRIRYPQSQTGVGSERSCGSVCTRGVTGERARFLPSWCRFEPGRVYQGLVGESGRPRHPVTVKIARFESGPDRSRPSGVSDCARLTTDEKEPGSTPGRAAARVVRPRATQHAGV